MFNIVVVISRRTQLDVFHPTTVYGYVLWAAPVGVLVIIHADAENGAAPRSDSLLQQVQGGRFVNTGRAPSGPEIQQHNFAAQIG